MKKPEVLSIITSYAMVGVVEAVNVLTANVWVRIIGAGAGGN